MINMGKSTEKQIQMLTDGMEYSLGYWAMLQRGLETRGIEKCHRSFTFRCAISVIEGQLCAKPAGDERSLNEPCMEDVCRCTCRSLLA
jgi:hypothetical protein